MYSADIKEAVGTSPDTTAAARLQELLNYVEQVVKMDEKPAFRLSEYRLTNGNAYQFHQHEFHALPGVKHDQSDEDGGPIWLTMERLKRRNPPKPSERVAKWLDLSADPEQSPVLREFLLSTVSAPERDRLVADGKARVEDCQPALGPEGNGKYDIRYRIEDHPQVRAEAETYIAGEWLATTETTLPTAMSASKVR